MFSNLILMNTGTLYISYTCDFGLLGFLELESSGTPISVHPVKYVGTYGAFLSCMFEVACNSGFEQRGAADFTTPGNGSVT